MKETNMSIRSRYLKEFIKEIQFNNRNPKDIKALALLDEVDTNPERILMEGSNLYRARVVDDFKKLNVKENYYGYNDKESFVPPVEKTRDMRANYRYIPYLYCSNDPYTAVIETRPRLGAQVSVATIEVKKKMTLLDFTMKKIPNKMSEAKKNLFMDLSYLYSKPITSEDDVLDYIPTQFIAEYAKNLGYDGIAFRSSLTPELHENDVSYKVFADFYNIVIFNYEYCKVTKSNLVEIRGNYLECVQIDTDFNSLDVSVPLFTKCAF